MNNAIAIGIWLRFSHENSLAGHSSKQILNVQSAVSVLRRFPLFNGRGHDFHRLGGACSPPPPFTAGSDCFFHHDRRHRNILQYLQPKLVFFFSCGFGSLTETVNLLSLAAREEVTVAKFIPGRTAVGFIVLANDWLILSCSFCRFSGTEITSPRFNGRIGQS